MGLLSSLFAAVSGLNANGSALAVIGNNIANTGTVGFKASRANFSDIISASIGGAAASGQAGLGVRLAGVQSSFTQGSLQTSGNALDMAVDGNGFFRVMDSAGGNFYTRAGQFNINKDGNVVNPDGLTLQGFQAVNGLVTGNIAAINLSATTEPPNPSTTMTTAANLNAQDAQIIGGFAISNPSTTANFSTSMTVYDSLGVGHLLSIHFTKVGANSWGYNVVANASDVSVANVADVSGTNARVASGSLTFTSSGELDIESATTYLNVGGTGIDFIGAAAGQAVAFDFGTSKTTDGGSGLDGMTQFGSPSALVSQSQNGYGAGSLQGVSISVDGLISGRFSNGQLRTLAQVALARFSNAQGMVRIGKNLLGETSDSGSPVMGAPDNSGLGRVLSNSLELSNVDLGEEFIALIAAQRGFQANARVVTTSDEMLGELVNIKR